MWRNHSSSPSKAGEGKKSHLVRKRFPISSITELVVCNQGKGESGGIILVTMVQRGAGETALGWGGGGGVEFSPGYHSNTRGERGSPIPH